MKYTTYAVVFIATLFKTLDVFASSIPAPLQQILDNATSNGDVDGPYRYPTDLTRGIVPKRLHSHNDYWRDVPFYSALATGCVSIEADVWLYNSTLFVGHEPSALTPARTLSSLYIEPIMKSLDMMNPASAFLSSESKPRPNGLYDTENAQSVYLHIDLKTPGRETYSQIMREVEPLHNRGYLTVSKDSRPLTIVLTGEVPVDMVLAQPADKRLAFLDAHLDDMTLDMEDINGDIAPLASTDFIACIAKVETPTMSPKDALRALETRNGTLTSAQSKRLQGLIDKAKRKGIGTRFWNTPQWPQAVRRRVQHQLWSMGVELISVDDLDAAGEEVGSWEDM
ncbi:MAG: hypothetical protein M1828_000453 [Chrysothrix sp. TS-e1954]|nr:MAG: hypothetical protein M1828_000453 [Chrysothrix sp. TS-e1954]